MTSDTDSELSFPDGPKMELDQLIDQLVDGARGVQRAQGRLRGLLRAIEHVNGELGLQAVLEHVVDAARELADAKYAALGVLRHGGGLEQLIHLGMSADTVSAIGQLPQGKGLLGALIHDPRPIRITHIDTDPRSTGFPSGHPPMASFLGVPIRVRGEVFGNLYLGESQHGEFTAEDEQLVRSLAGTAGTAISNARLYQESQLQQRWLGASGEISAQLLRSSGEDPLQMIARLAHDIADADLVTVALVADGGEDVVVEVSVGVRADQLVGKSFKIAETLSGSAIELGRPLLLRSSADQADRASHLASVIEAGPIMVLPLIGTGKVHGALSIARTAGRASFSNNDLEMAAGFASQASVALEFAAARADQERVALLEERDRIARDLHDHFIQQLFSIGLSLEGAATTLGPQNPVAERIRDQVSNIDRTIRQVRTSILELRGAFVQEGTNLRHCVLAIATELTAVLGFAPHTSFTGLIDLAGSAALADDVTACVREALTNVAKHAQAGRVEVDLTLEGEWLTLTVGDDGRGLSGGGFSGLLNLRVRAERRGGSFAVGRSAMGGVLLTWMVHV